MKANEIRKGVVIMHKGAPFRIMEFHHHTPGNLRAMVQVKMRNIITGTQTEFRFSSTEEVQEADVVTTSATYLYSDQAGYHFMNSQSYEEVSLSAEQLGDAIQYLMDQMEVELTIYNGEPVGVNLPSSVVLTVVETEPDLRGATASNSPKPAKTNTGLMVSVPSFIKQGEKILVSTQDGKYLSRAEK